MVGLMSETLLIAREAGCGVDARDEAAQVRVAAKIGAEELEFGGGDVGRAVVEFDDMPDRCFVVFENVMDTGGRYEVAWTTD